MAFRDIYRLQVALLIRVLPSIAQESCFALKGGTAINLFLRDMPRLSVDIDLTYLPVRPRPESLTEIDAALDRIADRIHATIPGVHLTRSTLQGEGVINKLIVRLDGAQIKIEVTPVLRGCVFDPEMRTVSARVEELFGFAEARVVSFQDVYGGKIIAALDRQHPRDLFDTRDLYANEGVDDRLRRAAIVYLLSHRRPMGEVLAARRKDISQEFASGFQGMTGVPVTIEELHEAREELIDDIVGKMPEPHRHFLVSFERGEPEWDLLGVPNASTLPAVQWRQRNLDTLDKEERTRLVSHLKEVLGL